MFKKISLFLALLPFVTFSNPEVVRSSPSVVYSCITRNGNPTTVAYTPDGTISLIVWKQETFSGSGWNPLRRCQEVSQRYQKYHDQGILRYIGTGKQNGYNIICVLQQVRNGWQCRSNGILITLKKDDDPEKVMKELFNIGNRKSYGGLVRGNIIDWEKYMQNAPIIEQPASVNSDEDKPPLQCQPPLCN